MKKLLLVTALAAFMSTAMATDVSVSLVRDATIDKTGARVILSGPEYGPVKSFATVTNVNDAYIRYGVGGELSGVQVGPVALSATGSVIYQDVTSGVSGYGLVAGVKAAYPITKNIDVVASVEKFYGQERISQFNGNTVGLGLTAKF